MPGTQEDRSYSCFRRLTIHSKTDLNRRSAPLNAVCCKLV